MRPRPLRPFPSAIVRLAVSFAVVLMLSACGGSSSTSSPAPPSPPATTFSISVPGSATISVGQSATVSVSITGTIPLNDDVQVFVTNLPAGVTATPSQFLIGAGASQPVVLAASGSVALGTSTVTVQGILGGDQTATSTFSLNVTAAAVPPPSTARIRYGLTNASYDLSFLTFGPLPLILYDPGTRRFFVSDEFLNRIEVFDAATEMQIGQIDVPAPFVGDETPDHSTIYLGTELGDVYAIDPVSMTVKTRYPNTQIGPAGFAANIVKVLASGKLALFGSRGGLAAIDGWGTVAIWDLADNSLQQFTIGHVVEMALTADRTKILMGSGDSDDTLTLLDPETGTRIFATVTEQTIGIQEILVSPDGSSILIPNGGTQVTVYNASTLAFVDQFSIGVPNSFYRCMLSFDGSTLFTISTLGLDGEAYNWRTHQQTGWLEVYGLIDVPSTTVPSPMAVDETGLIAATIGHGVAFLDGGALALAPPPGLSTERVSPAFGPVQGGTPVTFSGLSITDATRVTFGTQAGTIVSQGSMGLSADTPPGTPGPVDVTVNASDGGFVLQPQAFSYGPSIVEVTPDTSTADGGGTVTLFGYGFGTTNPLAAAPTLNIEVNGQPVPQQQYTALPFDLTLGAYPFPLESVQIVAPPGIAGSAVDISVSNAAGTGTTTAGLHYLPAIQQFPLPGATLVQGIYDPRRDVYYFTDETQVRVFSKTMGQWLASIPMPAGAQRLWGISLSPDGNTLAVADAGANLIYVLDPDTPGAAASFALPNTLFDLGEYPCGLVVTDSGMVYFATFYLLSTGGYGFHKLNAVTGVTTDYTSYQIGDMAGDSAIRVLLTADNSRVFANLEGLLLQLDTATDTFFFNPVVPEIDFELTLASNQTWMCASETLMDTDLNPLAPIVYVDRDVLGQSFVYGEKLSADGNLLFSPLTNAIDVIDGKRGTLITRIAMPVPLSENYDALVADGVDNVLIAIIGETGDGIAVVDLSSLSEPLPVPYAARAPRALHTANAGELRRLQALRAQARATGTANSQPPLPRHIYHPPLPAPAR
jgi:IPT/TIG domain